MTRAKLPTTDDLEAGLAAHMASAKRNGSSPAGVIRAGRLWLTLVGIRVGEAKKKSRIEKRLRELEALGVEGKALATQTRLELLEDQLEQAKLAPQGFGRKSLAAEQGKA